MSDVAVFPAIPHIKVSGDATSRGQQIGRQTQKQILHSLDVYRRTFELCDISWQQATDKAMRHLEHVQALSPASITELQGIATGAIIDFESLFTLNCRTEILPADFLVRAIGTAANSMGAADTRATQNTASTMHANECTSFAIARQDQPVWLAQNWDWFGLQRQALCVAESECEDGRSHITVTESGMLAKIGLNSDGFGITLNILRSQGDGNQSGMPVHILLRELLNCSSVKDARLLLKQCRFSSSSNVMVADAGGDVASFELSPNGVKVLEADADQLCHTNHFLNAELAKQDIGRDGNQSTLDRLETARAALPESQSMEDIQHLLSNTSDGLESICRFANTRLPEIAQIETVVGVVMNLNEQTLSVSAAQPSITDFTTYSLN